MDGSGRGRVYASKRQLFFAVCTEVHFVVGFDNTIYQHLDVGYSGSSLDLHSDVGGIVAHRILDDALDQEVAVVHSENDFVILRSLSYLGYDSIVSEIG